jgi:hypothetical protein
LTSTFVSNKNAGMAVIAGEAGRAAADIINAAQKRHVPVLTKRAAAAQAGISVDGWDKVLRTGRGRDTTFAAMARVAGVEPEVRAALGLEPIGDTQVADPRPALVRDNWDDENVRALWALKVTEDQRLALIGSYLVLADAERDAG